MVENQARAALAASVGVGDIEHWIAGRPWQAVPGGWTVAGELQGWRFLLETVPGGVRVVASAGGGEAATWFVPAQGEENRRRSMIRVVALCAASALLPAVASAQLNPSSATWVMPGCRDAVAGPRKQADYSMGVCMGIVRGISFMDLDMCAPGEVTGRQMATVVVHYIDGRPARHHESFEKLVIEALRAAWSCRR